MQKLFLLLCMQVVRLKPQNVCQDQSIRSLGHVFHQLMHILQNYVIQDIFKLGMLKMVAGTVGLLFSSTAIFHPQPFNLHANVGSEAGRVGRPLQQPEYLFSSS
jgi:hypothetical protein